MFTLIIALCIFLQIRIDARERNIRKYVLLCICRRANLMTSQVRKQLKLQFEIFKSEDKINTFQESNYKLNNS